MAPCSSFRVLSLTACCSLAACGSGNSDAPGSTPDASPPRPDAGGALAVWTQGMARKVQPTTAAGTATTVSLESCRDATPAAQIVVRATGGGLRDVKLAAGDLSDGSGHTIGKENLSLFRAWFIDFTGVTAHGGNIPVPAQSPSADGRIPDPLIPLVDPYTGADAGQPFDVQPDTNQPLVLDVHVPTGIAAGTYIGSIHVSAEGGLTADVPVSVTVWNVDLPDMRKITTHYKLSINDIIQYHAGTSAGSGTAAYLDWNPTSKRIVKRYEELAHAHRIDTGQQFVASAQNGCTALTDWADYDPGMTPYMDGTYWSDGVPSSRLGAPFSPGAAWGLEADCSAQQYAAVSQAWAAHLKAKGWFDRVVVYAADEPDPSILPDIAKHSSWLQNGDPDWLAHVMDTTSPQASNVAVLNPALGIYCVALAWYDDWNDHGAIYGRKDWPSLFAIGKKLWFYESNAQDPPYVTYATNSLDGLEPVIMKWGAFYEHATGFLYWDIAGWDTKDPWGPEITFNKTGDGVLVYPGNHDGLLAPIGSPAGVAIDGPLPSYRLKMVRAGLEDWALFALAEDKGLGDVARTEIAKVYSQLGGCTYAGCPMPASGFFWKSDETLIAEVRRNVAQAIIAKP